MALYLLEPSEEQIRRMLPIGVRKAHADAVRVAGPPAGVDAERFDRYLRVLHTWAIIGFWLGRAAPPTYAEWLSKAEGDQGA